MSSLLLSRLAIAGIACLSLGASDVRRQVPVAIPSCLHDQDEQPAHLTRRQEALRLAREINRAEGRIFSLTRRYVPVAQLVSLPPTPEGFRLRDHTDGQSYVFSLKDERDTCKYAVFSDQDGILYEKTPLPVQIAARH